MSFLAVVVIAALNYAAVTFFSFIFAGGDGNHDVVDKVLVIGHWFVIATSAISIGFCVARKASTGISLAALTVPMFVVLVFFFGLLAFG